MTYDEMLEFLREQTGRTVEVSLAVPRPGDESFGLTSFSGGVDRLAETVPSSPSSEAWRLWVLDARGHSATMPSNLRLDRALFEHAEVEADVPEEPEER